MEEKNNAKKETKKLSANVSLPLIKRDNQILKSANVNTNLERRFGEGANVEPVIQNRDNAPKEKTKQRKKI